VTSTSKALAPGSTTAHDRAVIYTAELREAFARACRRRGGSVDHHLDLAGRHLCLRFAGPALVPAILPALAHHPSALEGDPDLEVELWDSASTGVPMPPFPWAPSDVVARGEVRDFSGSRVRMLLDPSYSLTVWDETTCCGVFGTPAVGRVQWYERAAPLRALLHWSLAGPARHLVHSGAIGDERGGVLVAGPGGSGKTTTTLACVEAGMGYAGDDYVLIDLEPRPTAIALYGTAKIDDEGLARLPEIAKVPSTVDAQDGRKTVLDLGSHRPEVMQRKIPISAVLLPRIASGRTRLCRATAAEALRALAPSTILQHSHKSAGGFAVMAALVRRVPSFTLHLGDRPLETTRVIRKLVDSLT
jgi:hypothetical protein